MASVSSSGLHARRSSAQADSLSADLFPTASHTPYYSTAASVSSPRSAHFTHALASISDNSASSSRSGSPSPSPTTPTTSSSSSSSSKSKRQRRYHPSRFSSPNVLWHPATSPFSSGGASSTSAAGALTQKGKRLATHLSRLARSSPRLALLVCCALLVLVTRIAVALLYAHEGSMLDLPIVRHSPEWIDPIAPKVADKMREWQNTSPVNVVQQAAAATPASLFKGRRHTVHENGLLLVNDRGGAHPILELLAKAQRDWDDKLARQSKTLEQAVQEYKRRYHMNPPRGFDKWWAFAERHNVQLRDEYDQIHRDLAPFWALEGHDNRHRNKVMQEREHTFTLALKPGVEPRAYGPHAELRRATDLAHLLSFFADSFPRAINVTFVIDDNPAVMLSSAERDRMTELAELGEYFGPSEFVDDDEPGLSNFGRACPANSPLRKVEKQEEPATATQGRSFIHDHTAAVNLCEHPEFRQLHGHTSGQGVPLSPIVPLFTWAKTSMHSDILATPLEQYSDSYIGYDPPWNQKQHNKMLWRGSTTGAEFRHGEPWQLSQRARLATLANEHDGEQEMLWTSRGDLHVSNFSRKDVNDLYFDVAFAGEPAQCDPDICDRMRTELPFKDLIGLDASNQYKYLMDVDGNGWSGRFHRLMSSKSLVLKSTVFPEWYQDRIQPWVHYVPVKVDYSDLYDILAFFIGTPDGHGGHDSVAERLAENGRQWARKYWRRVDMASYMYRLLLEYSRILAVDDEHELDYVEAFEL